MGEWWENQWLRRHATAAPFGILATTLLLAFYLEKWQWHGRSSWDLATAQVDMGALLYAAAALLAERGVRLMFWALDQRRKWRAKWRAEAVAEGLAEGIAQGQAEGRAKGLAEGIAEGHAEGHAQGVATGIAEGRVAGQAETQQHYHEWLARVAQEKGIPLDDLLPPEPTAC